MTRRRVLGAVGALVATLAGGAAAFAAIPQATARDRAAISLVIERGVQLQQTLPVPTAVAGLTDATSIIARAPSVAVRTDMKLRADRELATAFAGTALAQNRIDIARAIDRQADPQVRVLDGGASMVSLGDVTVTGGTATATATVRTWATVAQAQGARLVKATPSQRINVKAALQRQAAGEWRITRLTWAFYPGDEP